MSDNRNFPKDWADELLEDEQSNAAGAPVASPAPQPEPTPHQDTAFNRIMGLSSMPPDASGEYDRWLFEKSYEAGAASERARADAAEREREQFSQMAHRLRALEKEAKAEGESLRSELREAREEIKRLILQYTVAECWWDDDTSVESPEEYADNCELKVGDTFELQAATYWGEEYRVTKIPDSSDDTYKCEQISKQREEFETYQQMAAELRDMREALTALAKWDDDHPRDVYYIAEYGAVRNCENGLNAICDMAKAALSRKEDKAQ